MNKYTGVIGIFNCQGAGSWPCLKNPVQKSVSVELSGQVSPADIEYFEEVSGTKWTGDCAVFSFNSGDCATLHSNIIYIETQGTDTLLAKKKKASLTDDKQLVLMFD